MKRRLADLPLHTGHAPPWLFARMWRLAGAVTMAVVDAFGPAEMLRRLSDPWWFQAFGCVIGMDWHSSGITTVTCGALKQAYRHFGDDLGLHVAGGKGGVSRQTPHEIVATADRLAISAGDRLVHASRMSAKVDSAALQDGFDLYHHCFFFTPQGQWGVVQQGMNAQTRYARRYHWLGESVDDFVREPHNAIEDLASSQSPPTDATGQLLLNMVATEAEANRAGSAELIRWNPDKLMYEARRLTEGPSLFAPAHHEVLPENVNLDRLEKIVRTAHERHPHDFATLLGTQGVGPATVRSLSLLAELIYDAPASHRDPAHDPAPPTAAAASSPTTLGLPAQDRAGRKWADYAYAHGGKDGTPHPVDRATYDQSIAVLTDALRRAKVGDRERTDALRRLALHDGSVRT